jgi:uncharacterized protein YoxC
VSIHPLNPSPRAITDGLSVTINHLTSQLPELVTSATRFQQRTGNQDVGEHVESLLELGAKAAAVGSASLDIEQIKRSLDDFTAGVTDAATSTVQDIRTAVAQATDKETGTIAQTVEDVMQDLSISIAALVAGEDAPLRTGIEKSVRSVTDKALGEVQRALAAQADVLKSTLATDNPGSPFSTMKQDLLRSGHENRVEIVTALNEVKTLIEAAKAAKAVMAKTAIKGLVYEDAVVTALSPVAIAAGDTLEPPGSRVGALARCKNGDAVVTLSSVVTRQHDVKIAVEAKDTSLTCDGWKAELARARKNRGAVAALGVARSTDHMPGDKRVLILDPLNIVVAFDPEEEDVDLVSATYHLLRAQAACVALEGQDDEVDLPALRKCLTSSLEMLADFDRIERAAGSARKNLDDISKAAQKLETSLDATLRRALTLLDRAPGLAADSDAVDDAA